MRIEETEDALQIATKTFFDYALPADCLYWHTPNGARVRPGVAKKMKAFGVLSGVPDFIILYGGKTFFLELKSKNGVLSKEQRDFRDMVMAQGFDWKLARNQTEVELAISAFGIPTSARVAA